MRAREQRRVHVAAVTSLILALAVRLAWVFRVQSPHEAVYSDMGGYVDRARALVSGAVSTFPRLAAMYPYGTHYLYAAEFRLLGYESKTTIGIVHATVCASGAYFFVLFAARFFERAWGPAVLGVLFAIWQPLVWCTGFFLSEVPYLGLLFLNAWLGVRVVETRRGGFWLGVTAALLFAVRPQFILTFALLVLAYLWRERRRLFRKRALGVYARVALPWIVVLAFSIGRYHRLTGHWGLISENGQLNRLFADTTVAKVEARWRAANGDSWFFWFSPPTKRALGEFEVVPLDGYFGDAEVLAPVRRSHLRDKSVMWRVTRALNNVRLLWDKNDPWPESDRAQTGFRKAVQIGFNQVTRWLVLPLACVGLLVLGRRTKSRRGLPAPAPFLIVVAHLLTLVILSMFFFPEARYRVPYDPFLLLLALAGSTRLVGMARSALARRRAATHAPSGSSSTLPVALRS